MFVERLIASLTAPQSRLGELDDTLFVDVDQYRALLMREARLLSETGQIEPSVASWAFTCIADGWVDDHLHTVRDSLLELGAVSQQDHLDKLLHAALVRILGQGPPLRPADEMLLAAVTQPAASSGDAGPLGMRLLARRYAKEIGLLSRASGLTERTPLGDAALQLPRHNLLAYLMALEMLQSAGVSDRWRTPRRVLAFLLEQGEFEVPIGAQPGQSADPEGLLPWRRVRRLTLLGLCEALGEPQPAQEAPPSCRYRLLPSGEEALREVLRDPPSEMVHLARAMLAEQTRQALRPLLLRSKVTETPAAPLPRKPNQAPQSKSWADAPPQTIMRPAIPVPAAQGQGQAAPFFPLYSEPSAPVIQAARKAAPRGPVPDAPAGPVLPREASGPEVLGLGLADEPQPAQMLDLAQIVRRAWEEIQARQVSFTLLGPAVRLQGDRRAMLQAWRELLRSAADAAQQGQATPTVTVEMLPGNEEALVLIHDNGPPLSSSDRDGVLDVSLGMLSEGPRTGLLRAHQSLLSQGAALSLLPPRQGGNSVRVLIPRFARTQGRQAA